ncbi:hypothetical protein HA466_0250780 [Hirschfeldia incana]|nr:hypothetical protein HA466_0250780 [Hirschfeldia incana]
MQIAGGTKGVTGVDFEKDQESLTVEGEDVDIFVLVQTLIKKVAKTEIFHVSPVPPAAPA